MSELSGKRVVVTRPREDFDSMARLLRQAEAIPVPFPTIQILFSEPTEALSKSLENLDKFDWLVLTSANGAVGLAKCLDGRALPQSLKLAGVGPKTAEEMRMRGWRVDFVPERYLATAILTGLGNLEGKSVLLARGQLAEPDLQDAIRANGGKVTDLVVYLSVPATADDKDLAGLKDGVDAITFTSASSVDNFISLTTKADVDIYCLPGKPVFAYIGPVTAAAAEKHDLPIHVVADEHTVKGLIAALDHFYSKESIRVPNE